MKTNSAEIAAATAGTRRSHDGADEVEVAHAADRELR
jgi:hypothetical protein